MGKMDGKVFLVYGGADGMAKASAKLFAKEGAKVVIADLSEEGAKNVVAEIEAAGGTAAYVVGNAMVEEDIKKAVDFAVDTYGKLDCMQYQPGINPASPIIALDTEKWNACLTLNLTGPFLATKYAAPKMIETAGGGAIVLTSSLNSTVPYVWYSAYCATKAGVDMFARVAALEFAPKVRVNTICPGFMNTQQIAPFTQNPEVMKVVMENHCTDRIGQPDDYANLALFLCSDDAGYITGSNVIMDGGGRNFGYPNIMPPFLAGLEAAGIKIEDLV